MSCSRAAARESSPEIWYTENFELTRTQVVVKLFEYGTRFISRSEARRLLHVLDRFRQVILDFTGVDGVGQGFADEVFRVWARGHPNVLITPINMNEPVAFMVQRALRTAAGRGAQRD